MPGLFDESTYLIRVDVIPESSFAPSIGSYSKDLKSSGLQRLKVRRESGMRGCPSRIFSGIAIAISDLIELNVLSRSAFSDVD